MKEVLKALIDAVLLAFPEDACKRFLDRALDWVEEEVEDSSNTWDDHLLSVCTWVRTQLDIADNDDPEID